MWLLTHDELLEHTGRLCIQQKGILRRLAIDVAEKGYRTAEIVCAAAVLTVKLES